MKISIMLRKLLSLSVFVFISQSRICNSSPHWARKDAKFGHDGILGFNRNYQSSYSNKDIYGGGYGAPVQTQYTAVRPNPYAPNSIIPKSSTLPTFGLNFQGYSAVRDSSDMPPAGQKDVGQSRSGWGSGDDEPSLTDTFVSVITNKINAVTSTISGVKNAVKGVKKGAARKIANKIEGIGEFVTALTKGASGILSKGKGNKGWSNDNKGKGSDNGWGQTNDDDERKSGGKNKGKSPASIGWGSNSDDKDEWRSGGKNKEKRPASNGWGPNSDENDEWDSDDSQKDNRPGGTWDQNNNDGWGSGGSSTGKRPGSSGGWGQNNNNEWGSSGSEKEKRPSSNDGWGQQGNNNDDWRSSNSNKGKRPASKGGWGEMNKNNWDSKDSKNKGSGDGWGSDNTDKGKQSELKGGWSDSNNNNKNNNNNNNGWGPNGSQPGKLPIATVGWNQKVNDNDAWGSGRVQSSWGQNDARYGSGGFAESNNQNQDGGEYRSIGSIYGGPGGYNTVNWSTNQSELNTGAINSISIAQNVESGQQGQGLYDQNEPGQYAQGQTYSNYM